MSPVSPKRKDRGPGPAGKKRLIIPGQPQGVPILGQKPERTDSVVVAYLHRDELSSAFHHSLLNTFTFDMMEGHKHIWNGGGHIGMFSGANITRARNAVVRRFLDETDAEWLWNVDADMTWQPDALEQLLHNADPVERPIVGGLCFGQKAPNEDASLGMAPFPTLFFMNDKGETFMSWEYPENQLFEVDATGAAFMLMHRSILEKMREKYEEARHPFTWYAEEIANGKHYSEDIVFCLRAKTVGAPILVHTGVKVGHAKPRILDEDEYQRWYAEAKEHMKIESFTPDEWRETFGDNADKAATEEVEAAAEEPQPIAAD